MPQVSQRAWEFALARFRTDVQELLDDPSWILFDAPEYIAEQRELAAELGFDFDTLVEELGTPFEIERLRKLETSQE